MNLRAVHVVLGLAIAGLAIPVVMAATTWSKEPWLSVLAAPHAAALVATVLAWTLPNVRWAAWACAGGGGAALVWALFLAGGSEPEILLILAPGPVLCLAAGVTLLRQNPKGHSSPLPSIDPSDARRP